MHDRHSSNRMIAVYLDADFDFSLRVLDGIQQYARRESDWRIRPVHGAEDSLRAAFRERGLLAGVVGALLSDQWLEGLPGRRVPMVNFSDRSDILAVSSVISDNCQVGRLAARHLLAQGLRLGAISVDYVQDYRRVLRNFYGQLRVIDVSDGDPGQLAGADARLRERPGRREPGGLEQVERRRTAPLHLGIGQGPCRRRPTSWQLEVERRVTVDEPELSSLAKQEPHRTPPQMPDRRRRRRSGARRRIDELVDHRSSDGR